MNPSQPLTSGLWTGDHWDDMNTFDAVEKIQITRSDIITFHDYNWPEVFERRIKQLLTYGRPLLCTEYMARGNGSTFDGSMPIGKRDNVGMINWGFVDGKNADTPALGQLEEALHLARTDRSGSTRYSAPTARPIARPKLI